MKPDMWNPISHPTKTGEQAVLNFNGEPDIQETLKACGIKADDPNLVKDAGDGKYYYQGYLLKDYALMMKGSIKE